MEAIESSELENLENLHYSSGPLYQSAERKKALMCMKSDELKGIYHLTESHAPGLRYKAIYRYEKNIQALSDSTYMSIKKQNVGFDCKGTNAVEDIFKILYQIEEMPQEWTIVQLTPYFNPYENVKSVNDDYCKNILYVTVFQCGKDQPKPFSITIEAPIDKISRKTIQIIQEMTSIISDNKKSLTTVEKNKHAYFKIRYFLNNRLKNLVKDIQNIWLKEWRCCFVGKLTDNGEDLVSEKLEYLLEKWEIRTVSERVKSILKCLIKSSNILKLTEIKGVLEYCFQDNKDLIINFSKSIYELSQRINFSAQKRHPIILVVDEKLDLLPWEMLDVLQDHPVSRMPSLHFTYALFKEHEDSIVGGVKIDIDHEKGRYIINPDLDLKKMETRLYNFFKHYSPNWNGLVGITPSCEEFEEMLLKSDIFSYNGHGNGSQFFSSDKIQKLRINSVVLLFGCGSVKYTDVGPQVEMFGSHQMYLIACSPCVVGMLWEVTDFDTDSLSTEFWSLWLPNKSLLHWKDVNKSLWETTGEIKPTSQTDPNVNKQNEPELLRALCKARKGARQFLTQASCVARGIPVKIK